MHIVYIYNGYKNGEELRYSLRSIEKHGRNIDRVWLLGHKPQWMSDKVTEITYNSDRKLYKENDITAAIMVAAAVPELPNRFLICADDYFYIRETDFDRYPIYEKNAALPDRYEGHEKMGGNLYVESLINTRALLTAAGLPFGNYSQHACFPADKKLMAEFAHLFRAAFCLYRGAVFDSMMANIIIDKTGEKPVPRKDNKIDRATCLADIQKQIGDTEVFSTTERCVGVWQTLKNLFPDKSKYEL